MRKLNLFRELIKEGKLKLTTPSEEVKQAYLEKSMSYLESARILLKNEKLEEAVSMVYYSMYYTLLALLFKVGIKSENHTASIILLKEIFNLNNEDILKAKKERIDKQYYVDFKVAKVDIIEMIKTAESFNALIFDYIERLSLNKIKEIRDKFKEFVSHV